MDEVDDEEIFDKEFLNDDEAQAELQSLLKNFILMI